MNIDYPNNILRKLKKQPDVVLLHRGVDEEIFNKLTLATNSVIKGNLIIVLIQGAMAALGFFLFGVPSPVLWGAVAAVAAVLYCAILKRENFELVVQKATEIGVREIVPLITQRTVKLDIKEERLRKIITEAAEQSGRGRVPMLRQAMSFADALADAQRNDANFFFDISDVIVEEGAIGDAMRRGLFVGPEGGWSYEEVLAARAAGCHIISLGALTFRAETAAIIASYLGTRP